MMQELREKKGLVYSASTSLADYRGGALLQGYASTKNTSANEAIDDIRTLFSQMQQQGMDEADLAQAKRYMIGSFALNMDSTRKVASMIDLMQLKQLGQNFLTRRNQMIEAVTLEDANRIAREYLDPQKLVFIMLGGAAQHAK